MPHATASAMLFKHAILAHLLGIHAPGWDLWIRLDQAGDGFYPTTACSQLIAQMAFLDVTGFSWAKLRTGYWVLSGGTKCGGTFK